MRKLNIMITMAFLLMAGIAFGQVNYKPNSNNTDYTGWNKLPANKVIVGATALTETKVKDYDKASDAFKNAVNIYTTYLGSEYKSLMVSLGSTVKGGPAVLWRLVSASTVADGVPTLTLMKLTDTTTIAGIKYQLTVAGVFTSDNYNGFAVYADGATNLTLLGQTADTPNAFKATPYAWTDIALTAGLVLPPGIYYLASLMNCSGTVSTAPQLYNADDAGALNTLSTYKLAATYSTGQNTFPATIPKASLTAASAARGLFVY